MESKIDLKLAGNYSLEDLKSAIINSLSCEYLIDILDESIKKIIKVSS